MAKISTDERLLAEIYKRCARALGEFSDENKTRAKALMLSEVEARARAR